MQTLHKKKKLASFIKEKERIIKMLMTVFNNEKFIIKIAIKHKFNSSFLQIDFIDPQDIFNLQF